MGWTKGMKRNHQGKVVTPAKHRVNVDVPLAIMETILKGFHRESEFDYEAIQYMVKEIKLLKLDNDTIDAVASLLNDLAYARKEKATGLKETLQEIASETTLDQHQDKMIRSISKMNADALDNFEKFIELGQAKVAFFRHTSNTINPIYKLHEVIAEALKDVGDVDATSSYGYEDSHRTRIRASSGASSGANAHSGYTDEPPTMENVTQNGLDGR
jgi:CRISPR/Cas system CSM-associated protein Csm2 small subunit